MSKEIKKLNLKKVLGKDITIPDYQRFYEWKSSNVIILFDDILRNYFDKNQRNTNLGTLILLAKGENKFDLVDGQQRLVTLSLFVYVIKKYLQEDYDNHILSDERLISSKSNNYIIENYQVIKELINTRFKENSEKEDFLIYLQNSINFYCIEVKNQNVAFQLFDGRNSKYKELKPIDLLKAYHIGEMKNISKKEKVKILYEWKTNMDSYFHINHYMSKNEYLFNNVFFNIYNWSLFKDRKEFEKDDIYLYKGYKETDNYKYVDYYKLLNTKSYQINKPFKSGVDFFHMVFEYVEKFNNLIKSEEDNLFMLIKKKGFDISDYEEDFNDYMKNTYLLYYNALFFFYDKFGDKIDKFYLEIIKQKIFKWSMIYRVSKSFASIASTNAYTLREDNNFFYECANAVQAKELLKFESNLNDELNKPSSKGRCGKLREGIWNIIR